MKELTKNILKKWGSKLKKNISKKGETVSLDPLDSLIASGDVEGAIVEIQRLKKIRKKLKSDDFAAKIEP